MAPKKSLFCIAALLVCLVIVNLQSAEACGGFLATCVNPEIDQTTGVLYAACPDSGGEYYDASINLNDFIGNIDGILAGGSGFLGSCNNLTGTLAGETCTISADCPNNAESYENTSYTVSNNLSNDDGVLVWYNC